MLFIKTNPQRTAVFNRSAHSAGPPPGSRDGRVGKEYRSACFLLLLIFHLTSVTITHSALVLLHTAETQWAATVIQKSVMDKRRTAQRP